MQAGGGLLVSDVMPIYMIIPRYSHNYAQFCQLLNSNLFTHCRKLMLSREATSESYGPRVYSLEASLENIIIMVGEQITVEQLIEKCIVMRISRHDHKHRHHVRVK